MIKKSILLLLCGGLGTALAVPPTPPPPAGGPQQTPGARVYEQVCTRCHGRGVPRAPPVQMLRMMAPGTIYRALTSGAMKLEANGVSDSDKRAVAEYLGSGSVAAAAGTGAPQCKAPQSQLDYGQPPPFQGWGLTLANTRSIPAAVSALTPASLGGLKLKWAMSFPNTLRMRSQPAIAGGALFVGTESGAVYSLNLGTGCIRWTFNAVAEVRTAVVVSPWKAGDSRPQPLVYFGDLVGNVYALDAGTGRVIWKAHPENHPGATVTATPVLYRHRLYVALSSLEEAIDDPHYACCTFRGLLTAYEARTGRVIWRRYTVPPPVPQGTNRAGAQRMAPSGASIWGAPTIDPKRGLIYVATGDNYSDPPTKTSDAVVALDLASGRIRWIHQVTAGDAWNGGCVATDRTLCPTPSGPDSDFGAATILATSKEGRELILAGQKSGWVYALDPDNGNLVWKRRVGRGGIEGGVEFGMAVLGHHLLVPINDNTVFGVHAAGRARPGLYALDIGSGSLLWQNPNTGDRCHGKPFCSGGFHAPPTTTPGLVLAGSVDGWLRIYDGDTGKVLWRYDTTQTVRTVGGGTTHGGSMGGGPGPLVYHHLLIAVSGYAFGPKMPGDELLVFQARSDH